MSNWIPVTDQPPYIVKRLHNFYCYDGKGIYILHHTTAQSEVYDYYTDAQLRTLYKCGANVPDWWLGWYSTQAFIADLLQVPEKVAIVGSRKYPRQQDIVDYVNALPDGTTIVSGGAKGVDTWAENAARARGLDVIVHYPDWDKHNKQAGMIRNAYIVRDADRVVAFWDGKSKGTLNSIKRAKQQGKRVDVYTPDMQDAA